MMEKQGFAYPAEIPSDLENIAGYMFAYAKSITDHSSALGEENIEFITQYEWIGQSSLKPIGWSLR